MSGESPESREGQAPTSPAGAVQPPPSGTTAAAVEPPPRVPGPSIASIWDRIKRHKVVEWTLAYVAVAYAVLHGVQMLRETFEWPLLVPRLTVLILLVGVPVAVTLAWYQGHRAQHRVSGIEFSILIALLLVAGSVLWWVSRMGGTHVASPTVAQAPHVNPPLGEKSIAVLPFIDLSEKHDQEYFADGMAEEVIDLLTRIPGINVISRTSSFQFKGKNEDVRLVGNTLGVNYVVEGSVRRSGERFRVTAQLISAQDGSHVWSDTYDESVGDALNVQDKIATNLVHALQISVEAASLERRTFKSIEAYDLYLRGLHAFDRYDQQGFESAAAYFQRVLELDSTSAPACEMLALTQVATAQFGSVEAAQGFERARLSAQRALGLDPKSSLAHLTLSLVHFYYDWDWAAAEREANEALRLEPRNTAIIGGVGIIYWDLGRWDESARLLETATRLDPLSPPWHMFLSSVRYASENLHEAEAEARKVLQISPTYAGVHWWLGYVLLAQGKLEAALAEMQQEQSDSGLARVYYAMGRRAESDAALARLIHRHSQDGAYSIANVYAYRNELDRAFSWLDRAYSQRDSGLTNTKSAQIDPLLKNFARDPRFASFLRKMNLPE
jgi:adenylate cyclase